MSRLAGPERPLLDKAMHVVGAIVAYACGHCVVEGVGDVVNVTARFFDKPDFFEEEDTRFLLAKVGLGLFLGLTVMWYDRRNHQREEAVEATSARLLSLAEGRLHLGDGQILSIGEVDEEVAAVTHVPTKARQVLQCYQQMASSQGKEVTCRLAQKGELWWQASTQAIQHFLRDNSEPAVSSAALARALLPALNELSDELESLRRWIFARYARLSLPASGAAGLKASLLPPPVEVEKPRAVVGAVV